MTDGEEDAKQQKRLERRLDKVTGGDPVGCALIGCLPFWCLVLLPLPLMVLLY